jgi:hypothetical protein
MNAFEPVEGIELTQPEIPNNKIVASKLAPAKIIPTIAEA